MMPPRTITRLRLLELTGGLNARRDGDGPSWWLIGLANLDVIPLTPGMLAGLKRHFPTIQWEKV